MEWLMLFLVAVLAIVAFSLLEGPVRNGLLAIAAFFMSTQSFAQIPTVLPSEVSAGIDDLYLLIGAASAGILGVLAVITLAKWARAMFS